MSSYTPWCKWHVAAYSQCLGAYGLDLLCTAVDLHGIFLHYLVIPITSVYRTKPQDFCMQIYVKPIHMQQELGCISFVCQFGQLFVGTYVNA